MGRRALALTIGIVACGDTPAESVLIDDTSPSTGCAGVACTTSGHAGTSTTDGTSIATTQGPGGSSSGPSADATDGSVATNVGESTGGDGMTASSSGTHASSSDATSTGVGGTSTGDASTGGTSTSTSTSTSTDGTSTGPGGTSTSTGAGSSGGTTTGGVVDLADLSDEFDDAATIADWNLLDQVLGTQAPYDILDIDITAPGQLAITPRVSVWYMDDMATLVYKEVTGDFLVEVDVGAYMLDTYNPPNAIYNSAGVMIRDPASVGGAQNWIEYNIGYQLEFVGLEGKATLGSVSELVLVETAGSRARLRMCRLGDEVHMLLRAPGDVGWTETHTYPDTFVATPGLVLPQTVQVGMVANAYVVADVHAEFEYIRLREVADPADCTAD